MTVKIIMVGECPNCGKAITSRFPFEVGLCYCTNSPTEVPLKLAIVPAERHVKQLEQLAEMKGKSLKETVSELLRIWL